MIKTDAEQDPGKKAQLNANWELHKRKAERAYQQLKENTAYSKSHPDTECLTFNLEKSLPTPVLMTGIV